MWPRTEEEKGRKRNSGFVSYMRREDAQDAKVIIHNFSEPLPDKFFSHSLILLLN